MHCAPPNSTATEAYDPVLQAQLMADEEVVKFVAKGPGRSKATAETVVQHALWRHNASGAGGAGGAAPKREAGTDDIHARLAEVSTAFAAAGVHCPLEQASLMASESVALFLAGTAGSGAASAAGAVQQALCRRDGGAAGAAPVMETPAKLAPPRAGVKREDDDGGGSAVKAA
jgi:hypothetical protein